MPTSVGSYARRTIWRHVTLLYGNSSARSIGVGTAAEIADEMNAFSIAPVVDVHEGCIRVLQQPPATVTVSSSRIAKPKRKRRASRG
jgi:hypothetical protein